MTRQEWYRVADKAYGNEWSAPPTPKICVVVTRYGGVYEGGHFAAIPVDALDSAAFGCDVSAAHWWDKHESTVGVGPTPNDALLDWYRKQVPT